MGCYDDSDPCEVFNIVDDKGKKAGFATFVEEMMKRLVDGGACFYPYHELKSVTKVDAPDGDGQITKLYFANGVTATATMSTILNVPQLPLLSIVRNSNLDASGVLDAATLDALHSVQTVVATKLYLYYPRGSVFWRKLGLVSGEFEYAGDARSMLLGGRYHGKQLEVGLRASHIQNELLITNFGFLNTDGQVECDDDSDLDTCHGFLLAVYVNDLSGNKAQFFRRYQRESPTPVTIISNTDLEGSEFLKHAHSRLEKYHVEVNVAGNYTGFEATQIFSETEVPTFAVLATWNTAVPWAGGAWHMWTDLSNFVVNEAYSFLHGWAEGSIKLADAILVEHFGVPRPWNFTSIDVDQTVSQTNSVECVASDAGSSSATGSTASAADAATDDVLCFTAEALVVMADGTLKKIKDVRTGDLVATGTGLGGGVVTEALVHRVEALAAVAVMTTSQGDLVGTREHPLLIDGEWIEFGDATMSGTVSIESRYVDFFYNLEVDGDVVDGSSHSYVVNGFVASGLGDNVGLNRRFPRQKMWKLALASEQ
jgi:hypothetical protein